MSGASVPPWPWSVDLRNHSVNFGDASDKNVRHLKPWKEHQLVVLFFYQVFLKPNILCVYIYVWIIPILYIRSIDLQLSMVFCLRLGSRRWICCGLVPYRCRFCGFDAETMWFFITQNQPFYLEDPMSFPKWNCLKPVHNIYIHI